MLLTSLYKLGLFRCSLERKQTANCHPRNISSSRLVMPSCFTDCPSPGHVPQLFCSLATHHPDGEHSLYLSITAVFISHHLHGSSALRTRDPGEAKEGEVVDANQARLRFLIEEQAVLVPVPSTLLLVSISVTPRAEMRLISELLVIAVARSGAD